MTYFEIDGEELELKITWAGAKRLNDYFGGGEAGSMTVIEKALQGDMDTVPKIIQAATLHTGKKFTLNQIDQAVAQKVDSGEMDLYDLMNLTKEVVVDSFFYKRAVEKMMKVAGDPKAQKALKSFYEG